MSSTTNGVRLRVLVGIEAMALAAMAMHAPLVSTAAIFGIVTLQAAAAWMWGWEPSITPRLAPRLGLLAAFVTAYFALAAYYEIYAPWPALKYGATILCAYVAGYVMGRRGPVAALGSTLAVVTGFVIFGALTVYLMSSRAGGPLMSEIADRMVMNPWDPLEMINGPAVGAFASLGMCLIGPALFAGRAPELPWPLRYSYWMGLTALVVVGIYANLAVQNRTPVLAMTASFLCCAAYVALFRPSMAGKLVPLVIGSAVVAVVYAAFAGELDLSQYNLFRRFEESGLQTTRYAAWTSVLRGMVLYPEGGRHANLGGIGYAHNLWLDVAHDAGPVPLLVLLAFQASHLLPAWRWLRRGATYIVSIVLVALGVSFFATFMVEPSMAFSQFYFPAGCLFLGLLLGLDEWSDSGTPDPGAPRWTAGAGRRSSSPRAS